MAGIIPFDFETNAVRVVMRDDQPWFVAADVCRVLEIRNGRDAVSRLDDDEKGVGIVDTFGGEQSLNIVSESGLFALIMKSRKPAAKRFRKWVTAEVLPAIRRDGTYSLQDDGLSAKRMRYQGLSPRAQEIAAERAEALRLVNETIEHGMKMKDAVAMAAKEFSVSPTTINRWRNAIYMVAERDIEAALAPKWFGARGMEAECHPEALRFYAQTYNHPAKPSLAECYRQTSQAAQENGWGELPCAKTMARNVRRGFAISKSGVH